MFLWKWPNQWDTVGHENHFFPYQKVLGKICQKHNHQAFLKFNLIPKIFPVFQKLSKKMLSQIQLCINLGHFHKNNKIQLWMAHFKPLLHTLRWLKIGIWTLYQIIFDLWKIFTWISGQKSFWRSFDSVFFKYNTLTLTSKIALIGQFWSPTTLLKMKKFKKNFQIPWSYPKTFNFWEN